VSPVRRTIGARTRSIGLALVTVLVAVAAPAAAQTRPSFAPLVPDARFPTNLAFAPDGRLFFTEKDTGRIRILTPSGRLLAAPFATLPVGVSVNETGLLGIALHPDFRAEPWVYAYYSGDDGRNHLVRIRADGDTGGAPEELLTLLPTVNGYHNGGDLAFGTDGTLFVAVGEGHVAERAQDRSSLGGKILRLDDDGSIPADNPFGDSPVYALGIRNSFGLCVGPDGTLWATDNGPTEWDELDRIEAGANYGWPSHLGPGRADGFSAPVLAWRDVIVPTGCAVAPGGSLYVGDFHGDLHQVTFPAGGPPRDEVVASFDSGITDVELPPNGRLFVATDQAIYVRTGTEAGAGGPFTPAGVVVLVVLIALLFLVRRRLDRR
jgi:glucose/arabinose dehydrogenase